MFESPKEISGAKNFTEHFVMGKQAAKLLNILTVYQSQLLFMTRRVINIFECCMDLPFNLYGYNNGVM